MIVEYMENQQAKRELLEEGNARLAPFKFYSSKNETNISYPFISTFGTLEILFENDRTESVEEFMEERAIDEVPFEDLEMFPQSESSV